MRLRLFACALAVLLAFVPGATNAEKVGAGADATFPRRPIRLIVPAAAGSEVDRVARTLGAAIAGDLGVPVYVVNRPGGDGAIGHAAVAVARPDGYTLGIVTEALVHLHARQLAPVGPQQVRGIARLATAPGALVAKNGGPWRSWDDVVAAVRDGSASVRLTVATAEGGREEWLSKLGPALDLPDGAFALVEPGPAAGPWDLLLSGDADLCLCSSVEAAARKKKGEVRVLAVVAAHGDPAYPETPALGGEALADGFAGWVGVVAPVHVPDPVVEALEKTLRRAFATGPVQEELQAAGWTPRFLGAAEFQRYLMAFAPVDGEGRDAGAR